MAGTPYYEAGSAGGKIQENLVFSLAIQKGKMVRPILTAWDLAMVPQEEKVTLVIL